MGDILAAANDVMMQFGVTELTGTEEPSLPDKQGNIIVRTTVENRAAFELLNAVITCAYRHTGDRQQNIGGRALADGRYEASFSVDESNKEGFIGVLRRLAWEVEMYPALKNQYDRLQSLQKIVEEISPAAMQNHDLLGACPELRPFGLNYNQFFLQIANMPASFERAFVKCLPKEGYHRIYEDPPTPLRHTSRKVDAEIDMSKCSFDHIDSVRKNIKDIESGKFDDTGAQRGRLDKKPRAKRPHVDKDANGTMLAAYLKRHEKEIDIAHIAQKAEVKLAFLENVQEGRILSLNPVAFCRIVRALGFSDNEAFYRAAAPLVPRSETTGRTS